jgi:O6-methylguanine-DNA--protein-cysteine methyltransferase
VTFGDHGTESVHIPDGGMTGFANGVEMKKRMLRMEGAI